jgi:hypothetical protein
MPRVVVRVFLLNLRHVVPSCERTNQLAPRHVSVRHPNGKAWARNQVLVVPLGLTQIFQGIDARSGKSPE